MATEGFKRKLAAIFSADVAGYSRLMGEDEAATVTTVETYRRVISDLIRQHRGRVVDSPGDNLLAEFGSVVDAVQCAVSVQKEIQARNAELPDDRRMQFRIGINLGDVIEEDDRLYGDGVNIAARLESLADPGGICVSKTAFEHIETKLPLGYEYLGEQAVKNIAKPVGAYKVQMERRVTVKDQAEAKPKISARRKPLFVALLGVLVVAAGLAAFWQLSIRPTRPPVEKASTEKMAFPLPDKPSIAVMPFANMTGDHTQDFFCDGLTESLIAALSKVPELFVIARESSFSYKGKAAKISQVSEELGVQYVLEGSVQRTGDRVRVTAQLVDALKGHHLWSERYDRSMKDLFDLQDEITMKVLTELQVTITGVPRTRTKRTDNLQAYLKALEGNGYGNQGTKEANAEAKRLYQEAIALDPNWAMPYANLANRLYLDLFFGASESPKETLSNAMELAQKAVELDNSSAEAHAAVSEIFLGMRQHDKAIEAAERAVTLNANSYWAVSTLANCLFYAGRSEESLPFHRQAIRLNPFRVGPYRLFALACRETGRYEEGIAAVKKSLQIAPNEVLARVILVSLYMYAGREDEARATVAEIQRIAPNFSVERFAKALPYKNEATRDRYIESLRQAGLK